MQVAHLGAVVGRLVERQRRGLLVRQRQVEAVAEGDQVLALELLLLVRGHAALAGLAHAVALLGLRQDHGRLARGARRRVVGGVDLHQVVAAALQAVDLLVGQALRQRRELPGPGRRSARGCSGRPWRRRSGTGRRPCCEKARASAPSCVAREQAVPVGAPHQLDHVPAGAGEQRLELVDDAAVAAHRAVEALQVAVDDPGQVVELLARGQRQRAHALRLVHLAVAEHAPDACAPPVSSRPRCCR